MATNLAIDPDLLERAVAISGERTKKAVVTKALQEFIARRQQRKVVDLMGKLEWDDSFGYTVERSRKCTFSSIQVVVARVAARCRSCRA